MPELDITLSSSSTRRRSLASALAVGVIRLYQRVVSPVLPIVTLGRCGCRFSPSCSEYAAQAVTQHGTLRGAWLAMIRLAKCTPLHPGGFDPVPPRAPRLICRSVSDQTRTLSLS